MAGDRDPAASGRVVGRVAEVWRFPVKSLGGERLAGAHCGPRGVGGDRVWAVTGRDGKLGSGKTTRRFRRMPGLLMLSAGTGPDGVTTVRFPDGTTGRVGDPATAARIGEMVGEPVELAREEQVPHFDAAPLHILSTSSQAWLESLPRVPGADVRRFRPNLLVETPEPGRPEAGWVGHRLQIGALTVEVVGETERCVMVAMAQPGLPLSSAVLGELGRRTGSMFGVYARVDGAATVGTGDPVVLLD